MKNKFWFLTSAVLIIVGTSLAAEEKKLPKLAIFPFTSERGLLSVSETDRNTLAEYLVQDNSGKIIKKSFIPLLRTNVVMSTMLDEFNDQSTGLLDIDAIVEMGIQENADYVVAGHITKFQDNKLALISIVKVGRDVAESRMLAGYYTVYRSLTEIPPIMPEIAELFQRAVQEKQAPEKILSIRPFYIAPTIKGTDKMEAETLAQILAIEIANTNQYDVRPRVNAVQTVLQAVEGAESIGLTKGDRENIVKATGAEFVLTARITSLEETATTFMADILNLKIGSQVEAGNEKYTKIREGIFAMPKLSQQLTGKKATGKHLARVQKAVKQQSDVVRAGAARDERRWKAEEWREEQKQKAEEWREKNLDDARKLWSLGASFGMRPTITPSFFADIHGTIPVTPYTFLEIGTDISTHISDIKDVTYFSFFPYGHFNAGFIYDWGVPFYIGVGAGYMMSTYIFTALDDTTVHVGFPVLDIPIGIKLGTKHMFDFSYIFQIRVDGATIVNHKLLLGYTYRFRYE